MAVKKIETLNKHENPSTNTNQFDIEKYLNENWDHIKDVVDNNAEELINTQANIETSQTEIIQKLKNNLINITTDQSNIINIQDCSDFKGIIDVEGNSVQETRSGKNKLDLTKAEVLRGGTIEFQENTLTIKPDGSVAMQVKVPCPLKQADYFIHLEGISNINIAFIGISGGKAYASNVSSSKAITLTEDLDYIVINTSTLTENVEIPYEKLYINEGNTDLGYEQYGSMPSPEYSSPIKNVEGNIDITVCNKNLFDKNNTNIINGYFTTSNIISEPNNRTIWIKCKPNTTYTVQKKAGQRFAVGFTEEEPIIGSSVQTRKIDNYGNKITNTSLGNSKYIVVYVANYNLGTEILWQDILNSLQIEENPIATEYVEHQSQTITFPLSEGQKLMKGDYLADDGIHHKRKQFEVDGTNLKVNDVIKYTNGLYYCRVSIPFTSIDFSDGDSTHFKWVKSGIAIGNCYVTGAGNILVFILEDQNITTVEGANNWLIQQKQAGTPVIVEYELAEEEIEPYTPEQQEAYNKLQKVLPYKLTTNIFTDLALLKFNYIADTKTYIDNKFNNLAQQFLNL